MRSEPPAPSGQPLMVDCSYLAPATGHAPATTAPLVCVLALVTIFIIYGSLYPFVWERHAGAGDPLRTLLCTWREWDRRGDLLSNILLYLPFGFFVVHTLPGRAPAWIRAVLAILAGTALSVCMELAQLYDEGRVTSMGDVYANTIGAAVGAITSALLGASMRWPFMRELGGNPEASLLLTMFLGYRLYPYVPVIDMHKYLRAVDGLLQQPIPPAFDLTRFVVTWLFIAVVVESLYGFRRWFLLFPMLVFVVFAGRIAIVDLSLTSADAAGAAMAFVLWAGFLHWLPGRRVVLACGFAGLIAALRLEPFRFAPVPTRGFDWVPFWSLMHGSINVAIQAFFEKFYQYGGLIWLLGRSGMSIAGATGLTAGLLFATSYAEIYLPGRSGETTDAMMAVAIGIAFYLLRGVGLAGSARGLGRLEAVADKRATFDTK
jgi:VanZ family protein